MHSCKVSPLVPLQAVLTYDEPNILDDLIPFFHPWFPLPASLQTVMAGAEARPSGAVSVVTTTTFSSRPNFSIAGTPKHARNIEKSRTANKHFKACLLFLHSNMATLVSQRPSENCFTTVVTKLFKKSLFDKGGDVVKRKYDRKADACLVWLSYVFKSGYCCPTQAWQSHNTLTLKKSMRVALHLAKGALTKRTVCNSSDFAFFLKQPKRKTRVHNLKIISRLKLLYLSFYRNWLQAWWSSWSWARRSCWPRTRSSTPPTRQARSARNNSCNSRR